jgi:hypothetical protein
MAAFSSIHFSRMVVEANLDVQILEKQHVGEPAVVSAFGHQMPYPRGRNGRTAIDIAPAIVDLAAGRADADQDDPKRMAQFRHGFAGTFRALIRKT